MKVGNMKKNKMDDVNIMEGINFKKSYYRQRKIEKTRRIQEAERKRKELKRKIWSTVELVIIGVIIYVLTGDFGELAQGSAFYRVMCILSWCWLLFGQFGVLYLIWCDEDENGNIIR